MNIGTYIDGHYVHVRYEYSNVTLSEVHFTVYFDYSDVFNFHPKVHRVTLRTGVNGKTIRGLSALSIASREGNIDMVNQLLRHGAEIDNRDNRGCTPLRFAAARGHKHVVGRLLDCGADVNAQRNEDQSTSLTIASQKGHIDTVLMLLSKGAKTEVRDHLGRTPLWYAAANGHMMVVSALRSAGARIDAMDNKGYTPLWIAAINGHEDVAGILLDCGADINDQSNNDQSTSLTVASQKGHIDIVRMLLSKGAKTEVRDHLGRTPLWYAAANGHMMVLSALRSAGARIDAMDDKGYTPLWIAAINGHLMDVLDAMHAKLRDKERTLGEIVETLIKGDDEASGLLHAAEQLKPTDRNIHLWSRAANGRTAEVLALLSAGANVDVQNNDGVSALGVACEKGHIAIVTALLQKHAQTEIRDKLYGRTPLWLAAVKGHVRCIELLIDRGAVVDALDYSGSSPVSVAAAKGKINTVIKLMQHNANFTYDGECQDPLGITGLLSADIVEKILKLRIGNGAFSLNCAKSGTNQPALMIAVYRGRRDIVDVLVTSGAYIDDRNFDNMQSIDVASFSGHLDIVTYLSCPKEYAVDSHYRVPIDFRCNTDLHLTDSLQTMESLIKNGADIEAENVDGLRPIHYAVRTGIVELVELLIQSGANLDAADIYGNTPLHEAACRGLDVVGLLVQHEAKLNVQNIDGKTPLHIAIERQQSNVIIFLLTKDADVGLTDVWLNTPLHYVTSELLNVSKVAEIVTRIIADGHQHALIPNTVGWSASMQIRAYMKSLFLSTSYCQDSGTLTVKPEERPIDRSSHDCQGNTPLHQVVGVYSQLKMFKIPTNVTEIVDRLVNCGADVNAQNHDGLTPLHVARGHEAIKACLQHANGDSFTITDKRRRTFWHLLFLRTTKIEHDLAKSLRLTTRNQSILSVDDLNRTPLHYACMNRNPWTVELFWLVIDLIAICDYKTINRQDIFGRTALHYAAIFDNSELISKLKRKALTDCEIRDNYKKTSDEYVKLQQHYGRQVTLFRLTRSSDFVARHHHVLSECVQNCFATDTCTYAVNKYSKQQREIVLGLAEYDVTSFVLNTWNGCLFDYTYTKSVTLDTLLDFPKNRVDAATKMMAMFKKIRTPVKKAMKVLALIITKLDRRFACKVIPVGSAHEETKIGCCDEFDYNFVLTKLSKICEVCYSPESPPGFVLLRASSRTYDKEFGDLFDANGILNTRTVKFKFETLAKQVLSSESFFKETGFEFIDPALTDDLGLPRGNASTKLNTRIKLAFTKPVNQCHVPHYISVDLVPALHIENWWPDDVRNDFCKAGDCHIVFAQPQNKYPWIGWTLPHGFITFGKAESRLLRKSPKVVKAAYMVVKRMSKYFCQYEFFSSHVIKTALLWCLDKNDLKKYRSPNYNKVKGDDLLLLVQNILRRLLCFAAQDYHPCYFLPKCHQPVWLRERHLKQFHMHLYRHGLTYRKLFYLSEQRLRDDEVLQDIKTLFTFSHLMYWAVGLLPDKDEVKLFVPSTINPLREDSYDSDE